MTVYSCVFLFISVYSCSAHGAQVRTVTTELRAELRRTHRQVSTQDTEIARLRRCAHLLPLLVRTSPPVRTSNFYSIFKQNGGGYGCTL